jgi:hypothetical protein
VHELELLVIVDVVETFQPILYATTFTIVTDIKSVNYFTKRALWAKDSPHGKCYYNFLISQLFTLQEKINVLAKVLSQIYEKSTAKTEAEIMEDLTINKSYSALTFLLSSSFPDQYSPLSYPRFATSTATSSSSVLSFDPDYCYYKHQPNTIASILGMPDHQGPAAVCDDDGYDHEYQDARHVPIFQEEAYKVITTLGNTSLQLRLEFSVFMASYPCQPSRAAIEEVQKKIEKL